MDSSPLEFLSGVKYWEKRLGWKRIVLAFAILMLLLFGSLFVIYR